MSQPTHCVLDIHALQVDGYADRGIGRYVAAYTEAIAQMGRVAGALLAPELPPPIRLPNRLVAEGLVHWDCREEARRLLTADPQPWYHVTAPFLHVGPDEPTSLAISPHWAEAGVTRVATLYDLIPLRAPHHYLSASGAEERYRARARWVGSSDLILAISDHTRREAIELLDCDADRVVNIGAGVSRYFSPPDGSDDELWAAHLSELDGRPFAMTVSGSDARKGTERLIEALGRLARRGCDLALVVVGDLTTDWRNRLAETAAAAGVKDRVVVTGALSDELLRACYRRAVVSVMPSLAEGSGLPVLESAACGTPALASSTTALGEVAATSLAVFDPADADSMADSILRALTDSERTDAILSAQQSLARESTWEAVAARAAAALDRIAQAVMAPRPTSSPLRRSLALVGPFPPHGGGIGVYNRRVLAAMKDGLEVDAVSDTTMVPDLPAHRAFVGATSFGSDVRPASYDAVVYTLGNSAGHLRTVELALRHPGWIWLHEVRLAAIATTALEHLDDASFSAALDWLLKRSYPGRAPVGAARRAGRSTLELANAGVGLVGPLLERCKGVLVNSEFAGRLLLLDLAPLADLPPIRVLPPACPPLTVRQPTKDALRPLVATFGVVSMAKRPDLIVDAAALAGCNLAFVGPCPPILAQVIGDRSRLRGIEHLVEVTGHVEDGAWHDWIDRATLAVQLRDTASGETSAAVLEALAAGLPVVTNLEAAAEFPSGTVSHLAELSAEALAARLSDLLGSETSRDELAASGQHFAESHQFDHLAAVLLETVIST